MFRVTTFKDVLAHERARLAEANDCHTPAGSPAGGQFCSKLSSPSQIRRWERQRQRASRAKTMARQLTRQMKQVGGSVSRALTLRKRFDVVAEPIVHRRQTSFWGTAKRIFGERPTFRGRKR